MRRPLALLTAVLAAASLSFTGSTATEGNGGGPAWSTRAKRVHATATNDEVPTPHDHGLGLWAVTRRDPVKVRLEVTWQSPKGRSVTLPFSWERQCWDETENGIERLRKWRRFDVITLEAGETRRWTWRTSKDYCEVDAGTQLRGPRGRLAMTIRDLK